MHIFVLDLCYKFALKTHSLYIPVSRGWQWPTHCALVIWHMILILQAPECSVVNSQVYPGDGQTHHMTVILPGQVTWNFSSIRKALFPKASCSLADRVGRRFIPTPLKFLRFELQRIMGIVTSPSLTNRFSSDCLTGVSLSKIWRPCSLFLLSWT